MDNRSAAIITEQVFNVPEKQLWSAITRKDEMSQWFFNNIPEFEPKVGFETSFLVSSEERDFTHLWKVTEVIPDKKIAYTWQYKEYLGQSKSSFEISENINQSTLKITCTGLETFPGTIPEFSRESCQQGWRYFMNRLKGYIENKG